MSDTPADRLRAARLRAGFKKAAEAAAAHEWTLSTYRSHDNGTRGFDKAAAIKYGRAFKVDPSWLLGISKSSRETEAAPQEPPQPWTATTEQLLRILAFAMRVEPGDREKLEGLEVVAGGIGIALRMLAKRPDRADDEGYWTAVLDAIDEAIGDGKSGSSR